jgi:glutathione S-transferase
MNSLVLFYSPGACSIAPHILLEETGEAYTLDMRLVKNGDTQTSDYLKINPKGRVPALRIGEELLTELPAISWYLTRATPLLRPEGALEEARTIEWFNYLSGNLHAVGYGALWRGQRFADDPALHPALQKKAEANIRDSHAMIERGLKGRTWAVGHRYGLVDPFLLVFYAWGFQIGMPMKEYPAWSRHTRRLLDRPAVIRAYQQEGLEKPYGKLRDLLTN